MCAVPEKVFGIKLKRWSLAHSSSQFGMTSVGISRSFSALLDPLGFAFAPVGRFRCASIAPLIPADRGNVTKYFGNDATRLRNGHGFSPEQLI